MISDLSKTGMIKPTTIGRSIVYSSLAAPSGVTVHPESRHS
jgi:hypothetical protein